MAALILLGTPCAFGAVAPREAYFSAGWAQAVVEVLPAPEATGVPSEALSGETPGHPDQSFHATYGAVSHMTITRRAFEMYAAQYGGGELARFIGESSGRRASSDKYDTVVAGAFDEDMPFQNPFGQMMPFNRHFWDYRKGDQIGWAGNDSAVNRAHKYWSGGFGLDGSYDAGWSGNTGPVPGVKGMGVVALYRKGDKAKAYWYLGHIAHLLEDMTVPAHSLCWPHPFHSDKYESYMGNHFLEWGALPVGPIESFPDLYGLFRKTNEIAVGFDAGNGPGEQDGIDGDVDKGRRRQARFQEPLLREEAAVLMPLAYKRVAALFLYFYKQVDELGPRVRLDWPVSSDPAAPDQSSARRLVLSAVADDDQGGVDRGSYAFEVQRWTEGRWGPWQVLPKMISGVSAAFAASAEGGLFAFRASAADAAGNVGYSPVKYLRVTGIAGNSATGISSVSSPLVIQAR